MRKINTSGIITTFAGNGITGYIGDNGFANAAELGGPSGLAIDDTGNIYIADGIWNRVRKVDTFGIITTVAGNGQYTYTGDGILADSAEINPIKVGIDYYGQLFIADRYNERVYMVNAEGIIHTVVGNGISGFSGDGNSATNAELNYPSGISFDLCGNLYMPEPGNHDIRKVSFNPECWPEKAPQMLTNKLIIYPNPAYDEVNIDGITASTNYSILNVSGIIEQTGILKQGNNSIAIQSLPLGVYLLELLDEDGEKTVKKIVKQ